MTQRQDKQLHGIRIHSVLEKRRLDQAMNAKEFAVCAGVSYSMARKWFQMPGFPAICGIIFWQDFFQWRADKNGTALERKPILQQCTVETANTSPTSNFSPRALRILLDS